jgi:hypothetical protein
MDWFELRKSVRQLRVLLADAVLESGNEVIQVRALQTHGIGWFRGDLVHWHLDVSNDVTQNLLASEVEEEVFIFARIIFENTLI